MRDDSLREDFEHKDELYADKVLKGEAIDPIRASKLSAGEGGAYYTGGALTLLPPRAFSQLSS